MMPSQLQRISAHIHTLPPYSPTDRPVLGAIAGTRGTLLVDAGNSPAHATLFRDLLAAADGGKPAFVALTHWHWDHVFGTSIHDLPTFAHVETRRVVAEMAALPWDDAALDRRVAEGTEIAFCRDMLRAELPDRSGLTLRPPDIAFTGRVDLDLGGITCRIEHIGGDHASDSSVVYVPEDKVCFLGDCLYESIYGGPRYYTTRRLFPLIDQLLGYDAAYYLAGHHPDPLSRADLVEWTTLLRTVGRIVDRRGADRAAIVADLTAAAGGPLDADQEETIDAFLSGLPVAAAGRAAARPGSHAA